MSALPILLLTIGVSPAAKTSTHAASPFAASASIDFSVGSGSFVAYDKADDPLYTSTLTLAPGWSFAEHMKIGAQLALTYEWTNLVTACSAASGPRPAGGPQEDCSDTNDANGRRLSLSDLTFSFAHDQVYALDPIIFAASASLALPTSRESRATNNVLTIGGNAGASIELEMFKIGLGFGLRKFFPTAEASVLDAVEAEARQRGGVPVIRCASFRRESCLLLTGFVPSWRVAIDADATIEAPWVEGLSATIAFGYQYSRRYGRALDAFSSMKTDAGGRIIVDGTNEDDSTSGTIEVAYELDDRLSFALGVTSQQPAKTADGKSLRFPFYDFISPASNFSAWYLSATFAY